MTSKKKLRRAAELADIRARGLAADADRLRQQIETMRQHWRPVPIAHPWQPQNPQCALCDEPRDAARHQPAALREVHVDPDGETCLACDGTRKVTVTVTCPACKGTGQQ